MSDFNNTPSARKPENESLLPLAIEEIHRRHRAEELARLEATRVAESEYDAAQQKIRGDLAAQIALQEIQIRQQAENSAIDSRIAANQAGLQAAQLDTERMILRENLANERKVSSNMAFGLTMIAGIVLVALLGFGIWYATGSNFNNNAGTAPAVGTQTARLSTEDGRAATVTTPQPSQPVRYTENDIHSRPAVHHTRAAAAEHKATVKDTKVHTTSDTDAATRLAKMKEVAATDENEIVDDSDGMDDSAADNKATTPKPETVSETSNE